MKWKMSWVHQNNLISTITSETRLPFVSFSLKHTASHVKEWADWSDVEDAEGQSCVHAREEIGEQCFFTLPKCGCALRGWGSSCSERTEGDRMPALRISGSKREEGNSYVNTRYWDGRHCWTGKVIFLDIGCGHFSTFLSEIPEAMPSSPGMGGWEEVCSHGQEAGEPTQQEAQIPDLKLWPESLQPRSSLRCLLNERWRSLEELRDTNKQKYCRHMKGSPAHTHLINRLLSALGLRFSVTQSVHSKTNNPEKVPYISIDPTNNF